MPRGKPITIEQQASAVSDFWPLGNFRKTGLPKSTLYHFIDRKPKSLYGIQSQLAAKLLGLSFPPEPAVIEPFLKFEGHQGALALLIIHHLRLYKPLTFDAYCWARIKMHRHAGCHRIDYATVYLEMISLTGETSAERHLVDLLKEGHVRVLAKLKSPKDRHRVFMKVATQGEVTEQLITQRIRRTRPSLGPFRQSKPERLQIALLSVQEKLKAALKRPMDDFTKNQLCEALAVIDSALTAPKKLARVGGK